MTAEKRGKELAEEMRDAPRTRPAAQQCPVCKEWSSWTHSHAAEPKPDEQKGGR